MKTVVNGITYKSKPTQDENSPCKGCVAIQLTDFCRALPSCIGKIWVKQKRIGWMNLYEGTTRGIVYSSKKEADEYDEDRIECAKVKY